MALDLQSNLEASSEAIAVLEAGRFGRERVRTFVEHLRVLAGTNRRRVLGKRPDEVDADYRAFADLAERARGAAGAMLQHLMRTRCARLFRTAQDLIGMRDPLPAVVLRVSRCPRIASASKAASSDS